MLPGIEGQLLSHSFIEQDVATTADAPDAESAHRELTLWRRQYAMLGPATTPRTLLQAAAPLFAALSFEPVRHIDPVDPGIAGTLRYGARSVALVVTPWGEPRDPLWRLAVTQAARREASWCLLFDGIHLRCVDAGRLYARRHLEMDLDLAIDNPRLFRVFFQLFSARTLTAAADDPRSLHALAAASDRHAAGVCRSLRDGVLTASAEVLRALLAHKVRLPPSPPRGYGGTRKPDTTDATSHAAPRRIEVQRTTR